MVLLVLVVLFIVIVRKVITLIGGTGYHRRNSISSFPVVDIHRYHCNVKRVVCKTGYVN